jgi:hypothetical protein
MQSWFHLGSCESTLEKDGTPQEWDSTGNLLGLEYRWLCGSHDLVGSEGPQRGPESRRNLRRAERPIRRPERGGVNGSR